MKGSAASHNGVRAARVARGLSQQALARAAGVTRQTIGGIEAGLYAPSVSVALRLARVLGQPVGELFWLDEDLPTVEAVPASGGEPALGADPAVPVSVVLARLAGRWVAHPLIGDAAFRQEMAIGDGVATWNAARTRLRTDLWYPPEVVERTVVLAGCSPALSLLARAAERAHPGLRVHWMHANSRRALAHLGRREIHVAGVHVWDARTGDSNRPFVGRVLPGRHVVLITLGVWEEGLAVASGRRARVRGVADLARGDVRIVNREPGAGARMLLSAVLARAGIPARAVRGFDHVVADHVAVARAVAQGRADAGVTPSAVAAAYGLSFIPLQQVRYDLVVPHDLLTHPPVRQLLAVLGDRGLRTQLRRLGGYDTAQTGTTVSQAA